jgi:8-oxo-dGTP diphosphatase
MVTAYVLGFAFNTIGDKVALIRKNKPDWQKGFLNGIGGKIEKDESKRSAMVREFEEECGIKTSTYYWCYYGDMISHVTLP